MDRTTKAEDPPQPSPKAPEQGPDNSNSTTFTAEMRFIVTRNTRNVWMDEMYESPPGQAKIPIFN